MREEEVYYMISSVRATGVKLQEIP